ncbi:MAG: hypothetical protein WD648_08585 [Planctomycetaceae bacterium]
MNRRSFLQVGAAAAVGGVVSLTVRPSFAAEDALDIGSEPQLFLDDWIVERSDGMKRVLHRPEKKGLVKNADGSDWDLGSVYQGNIVCRDARGRFHMTYRYSWWDASVRDLHPSIGNDKAHWFRESVGYATSDDGLHWEKPRLGLVDGPTGFKKIAEFPFEAPAGMSRDNNLGCPFDFAYDLHAHGNIVDPEKRFLLRAVKMDDTHPFAKAIESQLYFAREWPDIVSDPQWRERLTPIPNGSLSPRGFKSLAGFDHAAAEWFAVSQDRLGNWIPRGGRDIARFATSDLIGWRGPEHVLAVAADESRDPKDWIEYMDMLSYRAGGPQSGAWLGQLVIFHSDRSDPQYMMPTVKDVWRKGTTEVRLVISRNAGRSWQRVGDKQVWLSCSDDPRGFDRLVFSTYPVRVGDEAWFYYCAWNGDHLVFNRDGSLFEPGFLRTHRVARATMRWDGYVSLDATAAGGSLVTRPFRCSGEKLLVNANAGKGRLTAELQDASGRPLDGFRASDAESLTGDGLELPIRWRGGAKLSELRDKPIRLKLELTQGSLYGFRFSG